jgi:hypothetical protein
MIKFNKKLKLKSANLQIAQLEKVPGESKKELERRQKNYEKTVHEYALFLTEDCDWDWSSLFDIMIYKISRMRKAILKAILKNNIIAADAEKICGQMQETETLLKKVLDDNYEDKAFKEFYDKYGHPKMVSIDKGSGQRSTLIKFIYNNGREASNEMVAEQRILYQKATDLRDADIKKAMSIIAENVLSWWE